MVALVMVSRCDKDVTTGISRFSYEYRRPTRDTTKAAKSAASRSTQSSFSTRNHSGTPDGPESDFMLRSAGKNAAVNRSKFTSSSMHSPIRGAVFLPRQRVAFQLIYYRHASTVTPKTVNTQTGDRDVPPPSSQPRGNKKIELKPGPVKPTTLRPESTPPRLPPRTTTSSPYYGPPRHRKEPPPVESSLSAIALAKQDIATATERGVLLPPPEDATPSKRFLHQAIQLLKFYFRGLKAINTNRKEAAAIRARAKSGGALPSRVEMRLIQTYKQDVLKLLPFLVIMLVAEELIPFVALYAPRMLPSTCVLPGQRDRIASRARNKQLGALFSHRGVFETISSEGKQVGFIPLQKVSNPGAVCSLLGLPAWGPSTLNTWRIRRHLNAIVSDDETLRREGHGQHLTTTELEEALVERGMIPHPGSSSDALRGHLNWWLDTAEVSPSGSNPITRRLLMIGLVGSQK